MAEMVKIIASEMSLSTANTVGGAAVVRIFNNTGGSVVVTRANTGGTVGTVTVATNEVIYLQKQPADTLAAASAVRAVAVAFN